MSDIRDTLYPADFPGREDKIKYYEEVPSTMDIAREMAHAGCPHLTVVIADRQVSGRGRLKRTWVSDHGGLYFTLVLRPPLPPSKSHIVNFLASLVLAKILRQTYDIPAGVKWPNDILVKGKKICGMLSEMETETQRVRFINLGIGINVNNDPADIEPKAASIKSILGRQVLRKDLLSHFLDIFGSRLDTMNLLASGDVISEWKQYTITLNQKVRIVTTREVSEGIALDVNDDGALLLSQSDGTIKTVVYGDCFLL